MKSHLPRLLLALGALVALGLPLARADGLTDIFERKTLRVGVADFAPWTFVNPEGKPEGFEIDLGTQLAHDLGAQAEFKLAPLADLFAALDRGEIDLIAAGLAITPARARQVEFSMPYFESGTTLVARRSPAPSGRAIGAYNQPASVIVVVADTYSAGIAAELLDAAEVRIVPDRPAAEAELLAGRALAWLTNVPDARLLARAHPEELILPLDAPIIRSVSGLAVKRGNQAVLNYLNAWIVSRFADNFLPNLTDHWFGDYDWTRRLPAPATP
ncbi:Cystine-binding periplasmic protein precursor [Lacunisphaera limnophila]|uniref:Cystine-binding periplasmic protein n=1 Tax=Lacunisphaera limnophila TaxID=1838286 RepID=A0A1D8ARZ0_9BACT|nr:ABC transporter substrate-binding protein [Lacunisphaera limnophila]AOS43646.1 Cystine-binding periplasmic protein precursor [Lacunisphaera limnophila]